MVLQDLELHEAHCCECKKPIATIPAWLADAKVAFQCEECRQKHPRVAGMADIDPRRGATVVEEIPEVEAVAEDEEEAPDDADEFGDE